MADDYKYSRVVITGALAYELLLNTYVRNKLMANCYLMAQNIKEQINRKLDMRDRTKAIVQFCRELVRVLCDVGTLIEAIHPSEISFIDSIKAVVDVHKDRGRVANNDEKITTGIKEKILNDVYAKSTIIQYLPIILVAVEYKYCDKKVPIRGIINISDDDEKIEIFLDELIKSEFTCLDLKDIFEIIKIECPGCIDEIYKLLQ